MINIEEKEFEIRVLINDKGKKLNFIQKKKWQVEWKKWKDNEIGVVSRKKLQFESEFKKYQVLVDASITKKWFLKYAMYDYNLEVPPGVDYEIYHSDEPKPEPKRGETYKPDNYVGLVNGWRIGNIVLLSSFILILIVIIAFAFIIRRKKVKKYQRINI